MEREQITSAVNNDAINDAIVELRQEVSQGRASQPHATQSQPTPLYGSALVLIQFDVCEEIRLDQLRQILGARTADASFKHLAPGYVRYQRPPVEEVLEPLILESGERLQGDIKYFDYGVVSVVFELPFSGDWDKLIQLSSRWVWDTDFTSFAQKIVKGKIDRARPALVKLYDSWLHEDYFVFHVRDIAGNPTAAELLAAQGGRIAQIVRGENAPLSDGEQQEIMQSKISYYPNDLAVISWNGAFLYDSTAGAETVIQLLEYANSQLLEFRHYDELLTRELASVYDFMDHGSGIWARWRTARRAMAERMTPRSSWWATGPSASCSRWPWPGLATTSWCSSSTGSSGRFRAPGTSTMR